MRSHVELQGSASQFENEGDSGSPGRRAAPDVFEQRLQLARIFVLLEHAADQHDKRDHAERVGVGARVGARQARRRRHRDSQITPQPIAPEVQLLEGRTERVLGNHQSRLRRHDQSFRRQRPDCGVAIVASVQRRGRQQLAQQADHDGDLDGHVCARSHLQQIGEAPAGV